jgi:peptidyl-prolyl cis-trans isomerase D
MFNKITSYILVGFLIASVAFWGVGDIFKSTGGKVLASVDGDKIYTTQLETIVSTQAKELQVQLGRSLRDDERKTLEKQILDSVINRKLLVKEAARLGVTVSEDSVYQEVFAIADFKNDSGKFNKTAFVEFLKANKQTEKGFITSSVEDISLNLLQRMFLHSSSIPQNIAAQVAKADNQIRTVDIAEVSVTASDVPVPTDNELLGYYKQNDSKYQDPATRIAKYFVIDTSSIEGQVDLSDTALKNYYEQTKQKYHIDRQVTLSQKIFENAGDAKTDANVDKIEVGSFIQQDLINKGIYSSEFVKKLFEQRAGQASSVETTPLGYVIVWTDKFTEPRQQTFEEVRSEVKQAALSQSAKLITKVAESVEDMLARGKKMEDVAVATNLPLKTTVALTQDGRTVDGSTIVGIPDFGDFIGTLYKLNKGGVSDLVKSDDGLNYYIMQLDTVTAAKAKELAAVKDEVLASYKADKLLEVAKTKAEAAKKDFIPTKVGVEVSRKNPAGFSDIMINDIIFNLGIGEVSEPYAVSDDKLVVAKLTGVKAGEEATVSEEAKTAMVNDITEDNLEQYITYLRTKHKVKYVE